MRKKIMLFIQLSIGLHGAGFLLGVLLQGTGISSRWSIDAKCLYILYWFAVLVVVGLAVFQSDIFKNDDNGKNTE